MNEQHEQFKNALKNREARIEKRTAKDISDWIAYRAKNSGYGDCIENALIEIAELIKVNYHVND